MDIITIIDHTEGANGELVISSIHEEQIWNPCKMGVKKKLDMDCIRNHSYVDWKQWNNRQDTNDALKYAPPKSLRRTGKFPKDKGKFPGGIEYRNALERWNNRVESGHIEV